MKLINTKWYGSYEIYTDRWGTRLRKTFNPDGVDINEDELKSFELNPDFKKIPRLLFEKIVSFFAANTIESEVILVQHEKYLQWDALVPSQSNTAVTVSTDKTKLISLTDEKEWDDIPNGWVESGTMHSHPNMASFWSTTDDRSELKATGVHATVGGNWKTKSFTVCTSICMNGVRHVFYPDDLIDEISFEKDKGEFEYRIQRLNLHKTSDKILSYVKSRDFVKIRDLWSTKLPTFSQPLHLPLPNVSSKKRSRKEDTLEKMIEEYLINGGDKNVIYDIINGVEQDLLDWSEIYGI